MRSICFTDESTFTLNNEPSTQNTVACFDTFKSDLRLAANTNLYFIHFDVKTAFLNGELKEEIFMKQAEGLDDVSGRVCKLLKS